MLKYHDLLQELTVEIGALERQRDEFEAELKKVFYMILSIPLSLGQSQKPK